MHHCYRSLKCTNVQMWKPRNLIPKFMGVQSPKLIMHIAYSPYFRKIYTLPPIFVQFTFFAPLFDHDAFMNHALHVLDAPAQTFSRDTSLHGLTAVSNKIKSPQNKLCNNDGALIHSFIHCRHLYSASSSGATQKRSQPQRGR